MLTQGALPPSTAAAWGGRGELCVAGANNLSQAKRARQDLKRRAYNKGWKTSARKSVKALHIAIEETDAEEGMPQVQEALNTAYSALDRATSKGAFHKKTTSRTKGRLSLAVKKLKVNLGLLSADK